MHHPRGSNLSEDSFAALLDALGLKDVENPREEFNSCYLDQFQGDHYPQHYPITQPAKPDSKSSATTDSLMCELEYLADYDFGSDFDDESTEGDSGM